MNRENTSRSMRYYTIEYNRILHRLVYAASTAPNTGSIAYDAIVRLISQCRAGISMAVNVRRYISDMPLRSLAAEISENLAEDINTLRSWLDPLSQDMNTEHDILRFNKSILCICNSMLADMSERQFDSSIALRYIRESLPLCRGISETCALCVRYVSSGELCDVLCGIRAYGCETAYSLEEIRADMTE